MTEARESKGEHGFALFCPMDTARDFQHRRPGRQFRSNHEAVVGIDIAGAVEAGRRTPRDVRPGAVLQCDRPVGRQGKLLDAFLELAGFERAEQESCRPAFAQHRNDNGDQRTLGHWPENNVADLRFSGLKRQRCRTAPGR